ncbi:biopolymer transporter ExbD [Stagnihabitans tardus]|uniref:Biopolymer transporter ExbD n=1 Tax=Stagnihabitans tardus TaxID=2699202 RepID=A0AAE5BTR1_9RHOB|nr:biopolymer transporter ExbD [Stagnihabitans tardus]NBZ86467.1 biopolymer transporter ExbD [Stagnihabitans tardus]
MRFDPDPAEELAEINVTPFIDVMLVLLIVFMVAAPLSTVDVPIDLPTSGAAPAQRPPDPVWITLTAGGFVLEDVPLAEGSLAAALDARTGAKRDTALYLRADRALSYGQLMQALDDLRAAGYTKVSLVGLEAAP